MGCEQSDSDDPGANHPSIGRHIFSACCELPHMKRGRGDRKLPGGLRNEIAGDEHMDTLASIFEGFRFDPAAGCLFRTDGSDGEELVALGSRALALLALLVQRQGEVVSKDEIFRVVWSGMAVEESNLTVQISGLRRVLDRNRERGSCIQTVPGRGYRFVVPVGRRDQSASSGILSPFAGGAPEPPRLSIVVLPFANLSNDPEQQYFADGITDDLTTDLSRIAHMLVISRNTAFTYRNKLVDTRRIGRELGVRYVLEGSVRRSGGRGRINVQLIDAETDAHLWAERFDRDTADLFALQDEITSRIANTLGVELIAAAAAQPTEHPDALEYILRGRAASLKPLSRENYAEMINLFEHALALDPQSVEARSYLATALAGRKINAVTDTATDDLARAEGLASHALAASPRNPLAHFAKGQVLRAQRQWKEAILEYETALALNRNLVGALHGLGQCKLFVGSIEETISLVDQAIRLSPRDPQIGVWYFEIGRAHLLQSHTDEAIFWLEKARSAQPGVPAPHGRLAAAYALKGETERATAELAEARKLVRDGRYSSIARFKAIEHSGVPKVSALSETTFFAGLRKAGMPEE
jgi:TolB-like protein/Flp pilus assembly protein TadD